MHREEVYEQAMALKRNGLKIKQIHEITGVARSTLNDWFRGNVRKKPLNIHDPIDTFIDQFHGNARNKAFDAYSYTLGFYFARGHIYKNKRTYEMSFHIPEEKFYKFKDAFEFLFQKDIRIQSHKNISIYGKHLDIFYTQEKELQVWQTKILNIPTLFKGMVDAFDIHNEVYTFKTTNEKVQAMFRGCCSQFGISFSETESGKTEISSKYSLNRIKKILLDSWEDEL
jgi:hypothetical protein